jgi:hypothetical protein
MNFKIDFQSVKKRGTDRSAGGCGFFALRLRRENGGERRKRI